ncbi:MAG: PilZ domain-containing protein [Candidatus Eremiobacteraeota bacterium]|nr:PilZ domain-containing protein [Candidatus Eremiobacteraeota bacterium]MCW5870283.1 PilZ domain-containing protein [Candidatus Eremiobacteraeota bacterium]
MLELIQRLFGPKSTWNGTERRKFVRARCRFDLTLGKNQGIVSVRDIGQGGLRLECDLSLAPKLKAGSLIELTQTGESSASQAKVTWQKNSRNFCRVGLKFISAIRGTWMQQHVDDIAGHPKQKRRHIRVRTDWTVEGRSGIDSFEARMRDISITGCRVETKASLIVGQHLRLRLGNLEIAADVRRISGQGGFNLVGLRFETREPQTSQLVALVRKLTGG